MTRRHERWPAACPTCAHEGQTMIRLRFDEAAAMVEPGVSAWPSFALGTGEVAEAVAWAPLASFTAPAAVVCAACDAVAGSLWQLITGTDPAPDKWLEQADRVIQSHGHDPEDGRIALDPALLPAWIPAVGGPLRMTWVTAERLPLRAALDAWRSALDREHPVATWNAQVLATATQRVLGTWFQAEDQTGETAYVDDGLGRLLERWELAPTSP